MYHDRFQKHDENVINIVTPLLYHLGNKLSNSMYCLWLSVLVKVKKHGLALYQI